MQSTPQHTYIIIDEILVVNIENLPKDKTAIIIAHKLSTITKADKIVVLKNGEIKEIGTHKSLYKEKGEYYSLLQSL